MSGESERQKQSELSVTFVKHEKQIRDTYKNKDLKKHTYLLMQ